MALRTKLNTAQAEDRATLGSDPSAALSATHRSRGGHTAAPSLSRTATCRGRNAINPNPAVPLTPRSNHQHAAHQLIPTGTGQPTTNSALFKTLLHTQRNVTAVVVAAWATRPICRIRQIGLICIQPAAALARRIL